MIVSVSNLKVNNTLYAGTPVKITDGYPTINWEYSLVNRVTVDGTGTITSTTTTSPLGYELRIGDSSTNLGSDSFVGNISNSGFVVSATENWRYTGPRLNRGSTYYGQVRLHDTLGNVSSWATFKFEFNVVPTITSATITPSVPTINDALVLSYSYSDPDGDLESGTKIWWFRNGVHEREFDNQLSIDAAEMLYGDQWFVQIYPSDGYEVGPVYVSSTVTVDRTVPVVSELSIDPPNATTADPLVAHYSYSSSYKAKDESSIRWFVNNTLVSGANTAFVRLDTQAGDTVRFEVQPSDGIITGTWVASSDITILEQPYRIINLVVNNEREPLALASLTPTFSWSVVGPQQPHSRVSFKIGTAPGADNIHNVVLGNVTSYTLALGILNVGVDYWVTVAAGDDNTFGPTTTNHFRTNGSRWAANVSNSRGWTIETAFRISPSFARANPSSSSAGSSSTAQSSSSSLSSSSSTSSNLLSNFYQGIRVYDGTKYADIRLYENSIILISDSVKEVPADLTSINLLTITGHGNDIKIYINYHLILDGSGLLTQQTANKFIEFGAIGDSTETVGDFINIYYTTAGAFEPASSSQYYALAFDTYYETKGQIDFITGMPGGLSYFAASDTDSSEIFQISDYRQPIVISPVSSNLVSVNQISKDRSNFTMASHTKGVTSIKNYVVPLYDNDLNFVTAEDPLVNGWELVGTGGSPTFITSGLVLDTTTDDGKLYYTQRFPGSAWFDKTTNQNGWTVNFSLKASALVDQNTASNTDTPDGAGIYVNDGAFWENIMFFPQEITFVGRGLTVPFDTTVMREYVLVGRNNSLKLFSRLPTDNRYALVAESKLVNRASPEGNGGRPKTITANGTLYSVWHDDGDGFRQIFLSTFADGKWTYPKLLVSQKYGTARPSVAVDSQGNIFVAYESYRNDGSDVGMVVKNQYGWSQPFNLPLGTLNAKHPHIAVDSSDTVHLVWEDHRENVAQIYWSQRPATTGQWTTPVLISSGLTQSTNPSLDVGNNCVFVSYTVHNTNGTSTIYVTERKNSVWSTPIAVSSSVAADYSDLVYNNNVLYVVWHDYDLDTFELYARRISTTSGLTLSNPIEQLTTGSTVKRFPQVGLSTVNNNVYVTFEQGGNLSPYDGTGFVNTPTTIGILYFNSSIGYWVSSNQIHTVASITYGGYDEKVAFVDVRYCRRPTLQKRFSGNAHILYESDITSHEDEYVGTINDFTNIKDVVFDLTSTATYAVTLSENDLLVSGQRPRKEIRFGDFSDTRGQSLTFGYFKTYAAAVEPFEMTLIPFDNGCEEAVVNENGDAWLCASGLKFYLAARNEIASSATTVDAANKVRFDPSGRIYVLNDDQQIYRSEDHINFTLYLDLLGTVDFAIGPDNHMWVATQSNILEYDENLNLLSQIPLDTIANKPFGINYRLVIDSNNVVWVGTSVGIVSIAKGHASVWDSSSSALASDYVLDIAIRNSGIRYLATSGGLVKMTGTSFAKINITDPEWSENLTAVSWKDPVLWVAGGANLYQVILEDDTDDFTLVTFTPTDYANFVDSADCEDRLNYTFTADVAPDDLVEVYVNGRVVKGGYRISDSRLRFDSPLHKDDELKVVVRKDIQHYATLRQNIAEKLAYGEINRKIKKMVADDGRIYGATYGDKDQVIVYDQGNVFHLPYDNIVLDTTPPTGFLVFERQINAHLVQLLLEQVSDNLSGVKNMIISNYANLTSDGTTPLSWQPFETRFEFDIGTDFGNVTTQLNLTDATGRRLGNFRNAYFAGTASPARIYRFDPTAVNPKWNLQFEFPGESADTSVEFIVNFNQGLIVGTGSPTGQAKLWISGDGLEFRLLQTLNGTHALCASNLQNVLYIGTKGGPIFAYDGNSVTSTGLTLGSGVYSIYGDGQRMALYVGTGEDGKLYKVTFNLNAVGLNENTYVPQYLHSIQDNEISAVISVNIHPVAASTAAPPDDYFIFCAGATNGRIDKSVNGQPFGPSYLTTPVPVSQLKLNPDGVLYSAVGRNVYKYLNRTWTPVYTAPFNVHDIEFDQLGIWVIGDNAIRRVLFSNATKKIYFALQDVAGNATGTPGVTTTFFEEISLDDLVNFVNENRILELDEYGVEVFRYEDDTAFYSADKVEVETGEYFSEIFNGTTDHVSWQSITWDAIVPEGTDLTVKVRAADTRDGVLSASFTKTFSKEDFEGGDITALAGQYLQFKVTMTSTVRGKSPKLYRVVVEGRTRSAVHFYTTNFVLPSRVKSGILTANTFVPVAADIIFGINTNDSTDFSDYQIIEPDRLFTISPDQQGKNLRVGIKLISPLVTNIRTDMPTEYDEYAGAEVFNNIIQFSYTNSTGSAKTYQFKVELYDDFSHTSLAATLYTGSNPLAWSVDGVAANANGTLIASGATSKVIAGVKGNAAIRCNETYYPVIYYSTDNGTTFHVISNNYAFVSSCNPNFSQAVDFTYVNTGTTGDFNFRIKFFSDVTRTTLVKTFYSGLDVTGWLANGTSMTTSGVHIVHNDFANLTFTPTPGVLADGTYFIQIDAFDGSNFISINNDNSIRLVDEVTNTCGEYSNVPIVKDIGLLFELEDFIQQFGTTTRTRRTITLNNPPDA